jgi:RNAse (barnase) inhibitor barstar
MCMEFCLALANVYKVFAQTHSMYMEFWLALGNVYKVLMATIEHPLTMSWAPQDVD